MAEEIKAGCARPTGGPVGEKPDAKKEFATALPAPVDGQITVDVSELMGVDPIDPLS